MTTPRRRWFASDRHDVFWFGGMMSVVLGLSALTIKDPKLFLTIALLIVPPFSGAVIGALFKKTADGLM
jgi:uncharacterized membrane protein